jgi:cysteinyl-tRNA synthetase
VVQTARLAFSTYVAKKLPLLNDDIAPSDFQKAAEEVYASVIDGGALDRSKKPGPDEALINMHIKSGSAAAQAIVVATRKINGGLESIPGREFYKACEDVLLLYFDSLYGSTISGDDHSIFGKLTKRYEARVMEDMRSLNVLDPDELTRVTEYGHEIVDYVDKIAANGFAYSTPDGSVYFDINAFEQAGNHYAKLEPWNRNDKHLQRDGEGSLTKHAQTKRSKGDFALWKSSQPGEPSWNSPWGRGRPGWHIECSAMASAKLGNQLDIHSGGIDLAFPHHDNELAQSEAYWHGTQWVNYFLHMGHLSIQGSKMSKSLKNFTTIREALNRGTWTSRSLRIVFLLGGWREGIEITEDMIKASNVWEERLTNFFLKVKRLPFPQRPSLQANNLATDDSLLDSLATAQNKVFDALCDSFNTPSAMAAIAELVTRFNIVDSSNLSSDTVERVARWITSMVNILGLNGAAVPDSPEIGWSGIDIPEHAEPYLNAVSAVRDTLRQLARSKTSTSPETLDDIPAVKAAHALPLSDTTRPYADLLADVKERTATLIGADNDTKQILAFCDHIRDVDLFDRGFYLEDQPDGRTTVRPFTQEMVRMRQEDAERDLQRQSERERRRQQETDKAKVSPYTMFRTPEFGAWDHDGLPTKDSAGNDVAKSRLKKLRKEWGRQKRVHEAWVTGSVG